MFNFFSLSPFVFPPGLSQQPGHPGHRLPDSAAPDRSATDDSGQSRSASAAPALQSYSSSERFSLNDSFTISVTTKEGDQVEITFRSETRYQSDFAQRSGNGPEQQHYRIDKDQSSEFGFGVTGDLDIEEIDAIVTLVQDLSSMASNFFNGNLQAAMQQAGDLALDSAQLAEADISMKQSVEYRAIETYREIRSMAEDASAVSPRSIEPFWEQLQHQISRTDQRLSNAAGFTLDLFDNLVQHDVRFTAASETQQHSIEDNLERLRALVSGMQYEQGNESDDDH